MSKSIDFSRGIRGKHAHLNLQITGAKNNLSPDETVWAVCLAEDAENLISRKLYKIAASGNQVQVINEKGEIAVCPKQWFAVLDVPQTVSELLKKVA